MFSVAHLYIVLLSILNICRHAYASQAILQQPLAYNATKCCELVSETLPDKVFFPLSGVYEDGQASYYAYQQASLRPDCRITPTDASDVSSIVQIARAHECKFAVKSGGHMAWKGASNIGSASDSDDGVGGMAIDLGRMNEVVLSEESKDGSRSRSVSIGPGARWGDVYKTLEKDGLSTSGARMDLVGVGGFLVGGGISFYSPQRGFANHDVLNYELVLSNGTILDVNKLSHPSLFWALKMGSTNYGIVTRFDMITYPQGDVWAGVQIYPISDGPDLLDNLVTYTKNLHEDPKGFLASGIIWDSRSRKYAAWSAQTYLDPTPYPLLFHGLKSLSPYMDTMAISPLSDATTNMGKLFPSGGRTAWTMLSIRPDAKFIWDAHMKGKEIFDESILECDGVNWAVLGQPFLSEMFAAGKRSGGDPMNLKEEDGDLINILMTSFWNSPSDDSVMEGKMQELLLWAEDAARARGLLHPFIYMNYAGVNQDVMGRSVDSEDMENLLRIRETYDQDHVFEKLWKGGYKLGVGRTKM